MQICISILKGSKVMKSKAPNLEGLLQTPCEVLLSPSCTSHSQEDGGRERCKDEDKHFLAMRKDTVAHECVD
jgi:hypothetical protein